MRRLLIWSILFSMAILMPAYEEWSDNSTFDGAGTHSLKTNFSKSGLLKRSNRYLNRKQLLKKVKTLHRIKRYYDIQSYRSPQLSAYHDQSNIIGNNRVNPEPQPYGHFVEVEPSKTLINLRVVPEGNSQYVYVEPVPVGHKVMIRPSQLEQSGFLSENDWRKENLQNAHQGIDTGTLHNFPQYQHVNSAAKNENKPDVSANHLPQSDILTKTPSVHSEYNYQYPGFAEDGYLKGNDDANEIQPTHSPPNAYHYPPVYSDYGYQVNYKHPGFAGSEYWKPADNENSANFSPQFAMPNVNTYPPNFNYDYQIDYKHPELAGGEYWIPAGNANHVTSTAQSNVDEHPAVDSRYDYQVDHKHAGFTGDEYWKPADDENDSHVTRSPQFVMPNVNPNPPVDSGYDYQVDYKYPGFTGNEYWKPADSENHVTSSPQFDIPHVNPPLPVYSEYGYQVDYKHPGFTGNEYWKPADSENHVTSSPQFDIPDVNIHQVDSENGYKVGYQHPGFSDEKYLEPADDKKGIRSTGSPQFAIQNVNSVDSEHGYQVDYQHSKFIDDTYLKSNVEEKNLYNVTESKFIGTSLPFTQTHMVSDNSHKFSPTSSSTLQTSTDRKITTEVPIIDLNDGEDFIAKPAPDRIESLFEGSGELDSRGMNFNAESSTARFIDLFNSNETCTTPKGEPGHCRSLRQCVLQDVVSNFNMYLQYMCMTRTTLLGICCPDNPVIEVTNPDVDTVTSAAVDVFSQPPDGCGVNSRTRIVGGFSAKPHEWTWMVALLRKNRFFCGGVLINSQYVLTAAHCVMSSNIRDIVARLGEHDLNDELRHQQDIPLAEVKRHAKFTTLTFQNDIALLKLRHPVEFTRFVGTICLPKADSNYTNVNATVAGWGTVSFGGSPSNVLRQVTVPVWDNEECDRTYSLETINESFMCAGSSVKSQDACQGDSGGPLMVLNANGRWEVIGLVSWGRRCGDPNFPGVYTRVTTYLDWIRENAQ